MLQGLPDGITLHIGSSSPAAANDYYAAADVVAIPYDEVSTSGVMRYAYSAARPVVATSIGEFADHVMDGKTGRLVPPGDSEATASALIDVLSDRARALEMGPRRAPMRCRSSRGTSSVLDYSGNCEPVAGRR